MSFYKVIGTGATPFFYKPSGQNFSLTANFTGRRMKSFFFLCGEVSSNSGEHMGKMMSCLGGVYCIVALIKSCQELAVNALCHLLCVVEKSPSTMSYQWWFPIRPSLVLWSISPQFGLFSRAHWRLQRGEPKVQHNLSWLWNIHKNFLELSFITRNLPRSSRLW